MPFEPDTFRRVMRTWTTGVAILMARHNGDEYGMTINSFNSLSLDLPLVSVTLQNTTRIFDLVEKSHAYSITILSASQKGLAERFAGTLHGAERMAGIQMQTPTTGAPVLEGGLAWLDCRVVHIYPAGINTLFIAEVAEACVHSAENPLVYHNREYHQLKPSP